VGAMLKQYGWCFQLFFVICLAYFSAKIANVYIATLLELPRSIAVVSQEGGVEQAEILEGYSAYKVIMARNVFDSSEEPVPEPCAQDDTRPECQKVATQPTRRRPTGEAVKTSLKITVLATIMVGNGKDGRSTATIDTGKGKGIDVFAVADREKTFAANIDFVQVKPKRIEFVNNGRLEYAELIDDLGTSIFVSPDQLVPGTPEKGKSAPTTSGIPTGDQVKEVSAGKYVINQAEIDAALSSLDQLYTQIRAVPNFEGGKVRGMKILSIKPGSIFAKLGLRRGDVLDQINGSVIDIKSGFSLFNQLKEQKEFSLDIKRGGKEEQFSYEVR
jgi:general secretion pathway protein C